MYIFSILDKGSKNLFIINKKIVMYGEKYFAATDNSLEN